MGLATIAVVVSILVGLTTITLALGAWLGKRIRMEISPLVSKHQGFEKDLGELRHKIQNERARITALELLDRDAQSRVTRVETAVEHLTASLSRIEQKLDRVIERPA